MRFWIRATAALAVTVGCFTLTGCSGFFFGTGVNVVLTPSATNATYGTSITLTATVAAADQAAQTSQGTPTGSVDFYDGNTDLGTGTLSSGTASLAVTTLAVGTHTVYAVFDGSSSYNQGTSPGKTITITASSSSLTATSTSLSLSSSSIASGGSVTMTATVSPSAVTGSVNFYNGSTLLGSGTVASGSASITTTALPVGTDSVTATYEGDSTYASSTSSAATITVN
ncbi:Ig-like domain-containing protein [Terriglobus sp. RCC_193]|uniref:Ig-like domain-containing protein n=1 Tax=Terriglobus sp. RCC_193 TaxID=3239218 RepID=UPI003526AB44